MKTLIISEFEYFVLYKFWNVKSLFINIIKYNIINKLFIFAKIKLY